MALSQSVLSDLLDAFRAGEGVDLIRDAVQLVLQELIEVEATEQIGAARYERADTRVTERNGVRPRLLTTQAGDVGLRIPKLRKGSFFPSILEPRRRIDQALYAVVMEAYVNGVSTRSVDDLVDALGATSGIKKSEVSRICAGLDETVGAFRTRRLDHVEFPYVYLDATYLHVRNADRPGHARWPWSSPPASPPPVSAKCSASTSATARTKRSGAASCAPSKAAGWAGCGWSSPTSTPDSSPPCAASFQGASHQRCRVHFARNLLALVPKSHQDMVAAVFRTIFAQPDPATVASTWDQVRDQLADRFPKIAVLMDDAKAEVLAFSAFPRAHWTKIWSTNPLERLNKEVKRRARVVGIFPNEASVIRLVGAVLADVHDEWQAGDRRYLSEGSMAILYPERDTDHVAELTPGD